MKILATVVILLFAALLIIYSINTQPEDISEENYIRPLLGETPLLTLNLSSDKEVYRSSDKMELQANIETDFKIENLTVKVYGVKDRSGNYRVNGERVITAEAQRTTETFAFTMPSCYGCAGVSPGDYEIVMEIIKNGEIIGNFSHTVRLEK
jgi:hypothetical protein